MAPTTEILLFSAARAQLVSELVRPYLDTGGIVLCDRYADSTYAYQGYGLKRDLDELRRITEIATGGLTPDLTLYLDLTAEEGLERKHRARRTHTNNPLSDVVRSHPSADQAPAAAGQQAEWNRLDARDLHYHQRVEAGFQELMLQDPARWCRLDAHMPIDALAEAIEARVEPLLDRVQPLEQH
jgi:dTMP kinase